MFVGHGGETRAHDALVMGDGLVEIAQQGQAADTILDVEQADRVERRANIVEHQSFDQPRTLAAQIQGVNAAARKPDENGRGDAELIENGENVAGFHRKGIVAPVGIPV